jgi:hypothetical protein
MSAASQASCAATRHNSDLRDLIVVWNERPHNSVSCLVVCDELFLLQRERERARERERERERERKRERERARASERARERERVRESV